MNRVGVGGKGESVWLAWFLCRAVADFAPLAGAHVDESRVESWRTGVEALRAAVERHAWDGDWYRRGFFDDGTPLGSVLGSECRIDSIAQSWAVLSAAADRERSKRAMSSVDEYLVRREDGLVLLFTPPFDRTPLDPGYIKGYPPGIRENGGQYTHAAAWAVIALARLGMGDEAMELFHLINPINHVRTPENADRYRTEPYAVAADVYAHPMHVGRGGWTWYTGSAGWMYQAAIQALLGLRRQGGTISLNPCIPTAWPEYSLDWTIEHTRYRFVVENPERRSRGIASAELDGRPIDPNAIALVSDGKEHTVRVVLGPRVEVPITR
jgi:cyclic beta-1,2-glucan synthetase